MHVKGIIFDLDGVYFKNGTKNFIDALVTKYGVTKHAVTHAYLTSEEMQQYKRGEIRAQTYWTYFIAYLQIKATQEELLTLLIAGYEVNHQAKTLLHRLQKKGIQSIICSNNFPERIKKLEEKFHFQEQFQQVILSYHYGLTKPELLQKVLDKTGFTPEEILFIDDKQVNIDGAHTLGYHTILCEDPNKIEHYLAQKEIIL